MYTYDEAAKLIIESCHRLVDAGLIARTWGNVSARISPTEMLITPSGMGYDRLAPDKLVRMNIADGTWMGDIKPSGEREAHLQIYRAREDVNFVVHTHQTAATAVSCLEKNIEVPDELFDLDVPLDTNEKMAYKEILGPYIATSKYGISATDDLGRKIGQSVRENMASNAVFMCYHGLICFGNTAENAFLASAMAEDICQKLIDEKIDNENVEPLTTVDFQTIKEMVKSQTGYEYVSLCQEPAVIVVSSPGEKLGPTIDDLAQIGGVRFKCLDTLRGELPQKAAKALKDANVVFIQGVGAICASSTEDELTATEMVLAKNCYAKEFINACGINHILGYFDAKKQRKVYVEKYSKLK